MRTAVAFAVSAFLTATLYWSLAELITTEEDSFVDGVLLFLATEESLQPADSSTPTSKPEKSKRVVPTLEEPQYASAQQYIPFWDWEPVPFDWYEFASDLEGPANRPSWPPGDYELQD